MGCFVSLFCGIRESERRYRRRQNNESITATIEENNHINDEILVYSSESACFRPRDQINDESINKIDFGIPLKRKTFKWRLDENISTEDLENKRKTFWETCYTYGGENQVWDALKLICQDDSDDLELACSILDGCGVILPYGQLTEIYDSKGFRYNLPPYCVCDPVIPDKIEIEPCKSHNSESDMDKVKIRLSDGKDFSVDIEDQECVSDLKSYIRKQENLDSKRRMVVLWRGKILDDCITIQSLNLPKGAVLQVMVP